MKEVCLRGTSLVEVVIALLVGALVLQLALATVAALSRSAARLERDVEALQTTLLAEIALREEVRVGTAVVWPDSLGVRAFRGLGVPCGSGPAGGGILVRWRGARLPDPRKDSAEFVTASGVRSFGRLLRSEVEAAPCSRDPRFGSVRRLETDPAPPARTVLVRVFESGSYHLSDGALRYRAGRGGRQPLTPELFDARAPNFSRGAAGVLLEVPLAGSAPESFPLHLETGDRPGGHP